MGLIEEAKEEFAFAMKGAEVFLDACLMTAVCLKEQEQYDSASAQLERLLTDPRCQGAKAQAIRYELGLLYEKQENWQLARRCSRQFRHFTMSPNAWRPSAPSPNQPLLPRKPFVTRRRLQRLFP